MEAQIWTFSAWLNEVQPDKLKGIFEKCLCDSGFELCSYVDHHFKPVGYTGTWVLAESHFSYHTFPEKGVCYFELASCNLEKYKNFLSLKSQLNISGEVETISKP